jgi:type IV secretory pathway TraG/TraD family ATPase VirD4
LGDVRDDPGIYLGASRNGVATTRSERSALVLGPSRSGKTSALIVPNLLLTRRAVVATSTKPDVIAQLAHARRDRVTLLFDPSGTVETPPGVRRVGYSPLQAARRWDGAVLATRSLVETARRGYGERADDHWTERASALVAPLLHAAALSGVSMGELASNVNQRVGEPSLGLLRERYGAQHPASSLLAGVLASEERERSSIWSTASGLFAGLRTESARQVSREPPLRIDRFLEGAHHLHIVSPSRHQGVSAPLIVGLIDEIVEATYATRGAELLLALDELANVAPLPRLTSIVSEGGGQGVVTLACLQDLSQARVRWGAAAEGFLSLFPTTVLLAGIADRPTLELVQALAGRNLVGSPTIQHDRRGRATGHSVGWVERDRTTMAALAQGRAGFALALDERKDPRWIRLTPAHEDERFSRYLSSSRPSRPRERSLGIE